LECARRAIDLRVIAERRAAGENGFLQNAAHFARQNFKPRR
jgi:hypothetical protein